MTMDVWPRSGYYYPIPYSSRYGTHLVSYLRCTCECYCELPLDLRSDPLQRVRRVYEVRGVNAQEGPKELNDVFSVVKPGRRNRTTYKRWQIEELERAFLINPYPTSVFKKTLALRLGLRDSRVQVWFQNRRAKSKRDRQICQSPTFSTSTTLDHESDHLSTCAEDDDADHYQDVTEDSNIDVEDDENESAEARES